MEATATIPQAIAPHKSTAKRVRRRKHGLRRAFRLDGEPGDNAGGGRRIVDGDLAVSAVSFGVPRVRWPCTAVRGERKNVNFVRVDCE